MVVASFFVHATFQIAGRVVVAGEIKEGTITVGQKCIIGGKEYSLAAIEKNHQNTSAAQAGDMVGLWFEGLIDKNTVASRELLQI